MVERIKKFIITAALLGLGYMLASNHIIIYGKNFKMLKKSELTFEYTFYMIDNKRPEKILSIDMLREAGIGDVLVDLGRVTEGKRIELENKFSLVYDDEE